MQWSSALILQEGTEFAVTLAACTSDGTYGFRAIFAESKAELGLAVALP